MKHLLLLSLFCATCFLFSCQSNTPSSVETQDEPVAKMPLKETAPSSKPTCFESTNNVHNIGSLELTIVGQKATGYLTLQNTNPEAAHTGMGGFTGTVEEDIIFAEYAFMIEGDHQTQEVSFKMVGDKLLQGMGSLEEKDGILVFKDKASISYGVEFQQVDCQKIAEPISWAKDMANR